MKADHNLLVTMSNRNNGGRWQVFVTNKAERFIFGLREFTRKSAAMRYAEALQFRWSAVIEQSSRA